MSLTALSQASSYFLSWAFFSSGFFDLHSSYLGNFNAPIASISKVLITSKIFVARACFSSGFMLSPPKRCFAAFAIENLPLYQVSAFVKIPATSLASATAPTAMPTPIKPLVKLLMLLDFLSILELANKLELLLVATPRLCELFTQFLFEFIAEALPPKTDAKLSTNAICFLSNLPNFDI